MEDESGGGVPIDNVDIISCLPDEILQRILSFFRTFLAIKKQKSTVMADESGGRVPIDNVDMISSLPDEILHRILSFLPTFSAIKTCVLSKRWRHIWRWIPSVSLLECDEESVESVDKTLYYHKAPKLLSFHLGFRFDMDLDFPGGPITHHTYFPTDSWIEFALSHQTQILSLDFILLNYKAYRFPDILYHNSSVKRLSLILHSYTTLLPASTVFWPSLHSLCLDGCNIPDKSAATILSGCPLLQSLTLTLCRMLVRLDLSKSTHLTRLDIVLGSRNSDSGPTQIVAPHIHFFIFNTSEIPCTLDDVPSLTEAKLDVFQYLWWGSFRHVLDLKVLAKLHNIHKLTLGAMCLQVQS